MVETIVSVDAAEWLREPALANDDAFNLVVSQVNAALGESWTWQQAPMPARVRMIALEAIARTWRRDPGRGTVESYTRSIDDASRTERYASPQAMSIPGSVFTDAELAYLAGRLTKRTRTLGVGLTW